MIAATPAALFGIKMAVCLLCFLLGAVWLRRFAERVKRRHGLPPEGASPREALSHYLRAEPVWPVGDGPELKRHRQTIRMLARELERLDPGNDVAQDALALIAPTGNLAEGSTTRRPSG